MTEPEQSDASFLFGLALFGVPLFALTYLFCGGKLAYLFTAAWVLLAGVGHIVQNKSNR